MTAQSWIKFYPSDWRGDVKLQACSLAARGLWLDILCIMHDAKPYGHLLINGKPPSYYRIAQLVQADRKQVQRLMAHLKTRGVFGVTSRGILYSKRMVRDEAKSQTARELSKFRWGETRNAPVPYRKKEEATEESKRKKYPPNKQNFRQARHRWENDLLKQLGPDEFARAADALAANPVLLSRATNAELREPGSGAMAALIALQRRPKP